MFSSIIFLTCYVYPNIFYLAFYVALQVSQAMSKKYVKVSPATTLKDASKCMLDSKQNCVIVVDKENLLEGILTYGDIRRYLSKTPTDALTGDAALEDVCGYTMLPFHTVYYYSPRISWSFWSC